MRAESPLTHCRRTKLSRGQQNERKEVEYKKEMKKRRRKEKKRKWWRILTDGETTFVPARPVNQFRRRTIQESENCSGVNEPRSDRIN